jgi:pyruvate dehydrogenase E1 component beta subunit
MAAARLFKPASRLLRQSTTPAIRSIAPLSRTTAPSSISRRSYAVAMQKEYTVRDALNEALVEELESNEKVFILGEEVSS